jgi:RNA polymerase sigma-70 factor (ECF subfamily)
MCKSRCTVRVTSDIALGDPATFAAVYDEHAPAVHGAALRILGDATRAQDVTQDVFLRLWRAPSRFDRRRGELGSYLRLMARSRALDLWREGEAAGRARDRLEAVAATAGDERAGDRPAVAVQRRETGRLVRGALRVLPDPQREAVVLAYWSGMTAREIAARSGVPVATAKSRLRLGLARLRAEIEDAAGEPLAA